MAFWISTTQLPFQKVLPLIIITLFFLLPSAHSINNFSFTKFERDYPIEVNYSSDANPSDGVLDLTKNKVDKSLNGGIGRAIYRDPIRIWDSETGNLADFNTQFSFIINGLQQPLPGDGFTFFLSPNVSTNTIPSYVAGGNLGIYSDSNASDPKNHIVAVEFDTFSNPWDPISPHVGININSRVSETTSYLWINSTDKVSKGKASVSYSASTKNLSVLLSYDENPGFGVDTLLIHTVDLREILPEWVCVGFSATTGWAFELHQIRSWEFNSSLEFGEAKVNSTSQTGTGGVNSTRETGNGGVNSTVVNEEHVPKEDDGKKTRLIAGMVVGGAVLSAGLGGLVLFGLKMKRNRSRDEEGVAFEVEMDDEFERGTGPKRMLTSCSSEIFNTEMFDTLACIEIEVWAGCHNDRFIALCLEDSETGELWLETASKVICLMRRVPLYNGKDPRLFGFCHDLLKWYSNSVAMSRDLGASHAICGGGFHWA
ncbi:hypothetical protein MRB53_011808 [Persea americana]|uniref:Uncharacterized protein n=1 Tax=Persea americana TaxID=3435 RepID=A0ACC2LVK4_PERAE|nr:hypothetical protein MRB53_011808 [Persea americana]